MHGPRTIGDWTFASRDASLTVSPDVDHATVWSFDLEGRPISWFEDGCVFKRSLASEVHGREQCRGSRRRFQVTAGEARERFSRMLRRMADAPLADLDPDARRRVKDVLRWTPDALLDERRRFERAYRPVGILPPDQYLSIVVQATFGCSWNRCAFCDFYLDRPFRVRPVEELRAHLEAVGDLLGRAAALRRRIFLADGNALVLSNERFLPLLAAAVEAFPDRPAAAFVDVFTGERKPCSAWEELRASGLARVHVGIETGHDPLLAWMSKPGSADSAVALVADLKAAGLEVVAIFMVGVGGDRWAAAHERDTVGLLGRLPLAPGDIVYLSPLVERPGSAYAQKVCEEGIAALDPGRVEAQAAAFRAACSGAHPGVRVARYDLREFVY